MCLGNWDSGRDKTFGLYTVIARTQISENSSSRKIERFDQEFSCRLDRVILPRNLPNRIFDQKLNWLKLLIGKLTTKHDVPQCRMANRHGENPGAVSILHGDDRGDIDRTELCSVKVSRSLPTICRPLQRILLGQLAVCGKRRIVSTLWIPNVRKSQLCFHILHLTHCDSQASFFATVIWNEIYLSNKCVQESFSSMCARSFVRSLFFSSQELHLAMWDLQPDNGFGRTQFPRISLCTCALGTGILVETKPLDFIP